VLFVACSQCVVGGVATIFVVPGCRSATAFLIAAQVKTTGSCNMWQLTSAQVPQKVSLQQVVIGAPVAHMSARMSLPPACNTHASGACGTACVKSFVVCITVLRCLLIGLACCCLVWDALGSFFPFPHQCLLVLVISYC